MIILLAGQERGGGWWPGSGSWEHLAVFRQQMRQ